MPKPVDLNPTRALLWTPSGSRQQHSQMQQFMASVNQAEQTAFSTYAELYQWSIDHPEQFWSHCASFCHITFQQPATSTLTNAKQLEQAQWFVGAQLNFAENLLQAYHTTPDKVALINITEAGDRHPLTFAELYRFSAQLADYLRQQGIGVGDRVAALLPNQAEAVIGMLATTSLGAIWTSCSPDFGEQSLLDRFGQTTPKALIAVDAYRYKGKLHSTVDRINALQNAIASLNTIIIIPMLQQPDSTDSNRAQRCLWSEALAQARTDQHTFEPVAFNAPVYILYSSGTTGKPKCIVHGVGGTLLQHSKELRLHTDISQDDVVFYFTTCGWMMWNWLISTLITGATTVLYDGNPFYPSNARLIELIAEERITVFGAGARFYAELEKLGIDPAKQLPAGSLDHLKTLLSTGSALSPASFRYLYHAFKKDLCVASISGGTDIVSCFVLGNPLLPVYEGELQSRGLGMAVNVFDDQGNPLDDQKGELVCTQPFPSMPIGFWGDPDGSRYHNTYFARFANVWAHGDFAELSSATGGMIIHGRSDTVLNPGGVRIGTAEIYRQLDHIDSILEAVAVDQTWQGDTRILLFVKLKPNTALDEALINTIQQTIRTGASPRHVPAVVTAVEDIPRTFSGKVVELAVKNIIHQQTVNNLGAIANPESLDYFRNLPGISD